MLTVKKIFNEAIKIGMKNDFRTKNELEMYLKNKKEEFEALPKEEKKYYDLEKLTNPYADSRIHFDGGKKEIKTALVGIDVSMGAIVLAKELGVDLVINHHPVGTALANLDSVMDLQVDMMEKFGVPVNIAEKLIEERISEVARGINPVNHQAVVDAARLLKINLINIHTPADNCVTQFITEKISKAKTRYVGDVLKVLNEIEEYQIAKKQGVGPVLFTGSKKNRCGKVVVSEMTGGTEGAKEIYSAMANAGIGTVIGMHQSEAHRKEARKAYINVVVAGHISSDSIGMNLILDELEKQGLQIIPFSGLIRVSRNKGKK